MLFVIALKSIAFAMAALPLGGCAMGIGSIFAALLSSESYAPEMSSALFGRAMLGFALVETFMVVMLVVLGMIYTF